MFRKSAEKDEIDIAAYYIENYYENEIKILDNGRITIAGYIEKYNFEYVMECIEIACNQYYDPEEMWEKLGGILYNRRHTIDSIRMGD